MRKGLIYIMCVSACLSLSSKSICQKNDTIFPRYTGNRDIDVHIQDGRQPWTIGAHSYGVFRAHNFDGKTHDKEGLGYQFNHHPNLVYWKNHYWVSYQGGPTDGAEGDKPAVPYLITYSENGRKWEAPEILFPAIRFNGELTYMHTRMGFYVSTDGRLLSVSFHGRHKTPNGGGDNGVARVVREICGIKADSRVDMGPVYAIRFNNGRNVENTGLQFYTSSSDKGFVAACDELVNNKLITQQWFEEDRRAELYTINLNTPNEGPNVEKKNNEAKAFDWYTLPSGRIIGWWKGAAMAYSDDGWQTASNIHIDYNRLNEHRTAKTWGQKLSNNAYAMVYCLETQPKNPATEWSWVRSPLVVSPSNDGLNYNTNRSVIFGDVAPSRYINPPLAGGLNDNRDAGPQYVRGISETNTGKPNTQEPTGNLWVTYSVNKEDIWVSEVPVNIRHKADQPVSDNFEIYSGQNLFGDWIILSPAWAPISLGEENNNKFMRLNDKDPYDYAKAMRVFPVDTKAEINFRVRAGQTNHGLLNIDITDKQGKVAARLEFGDEGRISTPDGKTLIVMTYAANKWMDVKLVIDCSKQQYSLSINGKKQLSKIPFHEKTAQIERFEVRTGAYRMDDFSRIGTWKAYPATTLPNADKALPLAIFDLDNLVIK